MRVAEKLETLIKEDSGHTYLYLSGKSANLEEVHYWCLSTCDMHKAKTRVILVLPDAVFKVMHGVDGVFADKGVMEEPFIRRCLKMEPSSFVVWVDPETQEVAQ